LTKKGIGKSLIMIAVFDVHYIENSFASAAAVLFSDYTNSIPNAEYSCHLWNMADYIPGEFYKRELPCIIKLYEQIEVSLEEMIIDGYVMLGDKPGLGQYLYDSLDHKIPIIGVAKSNFKGSKGAEVFRGRSQKPLYVTTAGMDLQEACENIKRMHGNYRIPTLLKRVDLLAKEKALIDSELRCPPRIWKSK
jgi:deoxyinosine 3'endonuclease (endonuclease V)